MGAALAALECTGVRDPMTVPFVADFSGDAMSYDCTVNRQLPTHGVPVPTTSLGWPVSPGLVPVHCMLRAAAGTKLLIAGRLRVTGGPSARSNAPFFYLQLRASSCRETTPAKQEATALVVAFTAKKQQGSMFVRTTITVATPQRVYLDAAWAVDDLVGPLTEECMLDFAVHDDGRNLHLDVMVRTPHGTRRSTLQDWMAFNNHVSPCYVNVGGCTVGCGVVLQNLVIQEMQHENPPQLRSIFKGRRIEGSPDSWHHVAYPESAGSVARFKGELWLTTRDVEKAGTFLEATLTAAEALALACVFRFGCSLDYLGLIEAQASKFLAVSSIPCRGVAVGLDEDSEDPNILRMFVEYRGQVIEDMVVCHLPPEQRESAQVCLEVFDDMVQFLFRVCINHRGAVQQAVLEVSGDRLDASLEGYSRGGLLSSRYTSRYFASPLELSANSYDCEMSQSMNRVLVFLHAKRNGRPLSERVRLQSLREPPFSCFPVSLSTG
mmetsp:Transcript_134163/g.304245  ORF Transcript_134163/g.304245 Transcript_134163/m.304245 type:complete len:493 (+) Transcript_134163:45-1523(+)